MTGTILGTETEYAVVGHAPFREVVPPHEVARTLKEVARRALVCARGPAGLFLANGGRFYVDVGGHPEWATPETTDPLETVRYTVAGDRLLGFLARLAALGASLRRVDVFRAGAGCVDWWRSTWGQHENYLSDTPARALRSQLVSHLASRVVFSGEGGLAPGDGGLRFVLSARLQRLVWRACRDAQPETFPFVTEKDVLRLDGRLYFRLHVPLGSPLLSHLALWLKLGTTALVIRLAERELLTSPDLTVESPVGALLRYAEDPDLRARVRVQSGEMLTAVELQWRIANRAARYVDEPFMPPWAPRLCAAWKRILTLLGGRDPEIHRRLDWAIRRRVLAEVHRVPFRAPWWRGFRRPLRPGEEDAPRWWRAFLDPKTETLQAADLRFGQVDRSGIFEQLDARGLLAHRLLDEGAIARAMREPPADTRAAARGRAVRRLHATGSEALVSWGRVLDPERELTLELPDPRIAEEQWKLLPRDAEEELDPCWWTLDDEPARILPMGPFLHYQRLD